ncbi:MAG: DUF2130 domain-containing protein [Muribaculaceae bacterium]|nr:DUF2130 domain-containing protein [Muribaculaceae bacterium]
MKEIICPKCGTTFKVDESDYAAIVAQVRNTEFEKEINRRIAEVEQKHKADERANALSAERNFDRRLADKDREASTMRQEIERLKALIDNYNNEKKAELEAIRARHQVDILNERNSCSEELNRRQQTIIELNSQLKADHAAARTREQELINRHNMQLADKQQEIDRLKDYKLRLSTKMIGESLETHCSTQFMQMQSYGLFPYAEFGKDNDARLGSKGDFIFRDFVDGTEYISIMFEMKNEADATAVKHRNTDFLEKLDKDRRNKGCEYAVLVTMLEQNNEVYDNGIVDMSHLYSKMYVIRPQFFIPLMRILTEAAKKNLDEIISLKEELAVSREQSVDLARFEEKLLKFRTGFERNVAAARSKYEAAITGIDKIIDDLEKQIKALRAVQANFQTSEEKLLKADETVEKDLTIKKLTYGNPGMKARFEQARKDSGISE